MNIDAYEFEGRIEDLSEMLQKKLQRKINIHRNTLQIDEVPASKVRDALKQTLHKLEPESYHVISKSGSFKIKRVKIRSHKSKPREGTPPSAPQSMPYFFPG